MKKNVVVFLISTILLTLISTLVSKLSMDSIWNFGFSYSIANDSIPYKDFNMVILPFFQLIMAFFLKIFGIKLVVYHIINAFQRSYRGFSVFSFMAIL